MFFAYASGGYSIFKSGMVQSNDTSSNVAYGFGVYAAENRSLGMALMRDQASFAFELNKSSLSYELQDVHLRYRLGPVYAGVIFSQSHWTLASPADLDGDERPDPDGAPEPLLEAMGTGFGGALGISVDVMRRNSVYLDLTYAAAQTPLEKASSTADGTLVERKVVLGARSDVDLGAKFEISRNFYVISGFRYRRVSLGIEGRDASETNATTYLGLRFEAGT